MTVPINLNYNHIFRSLYSTALNPTFQSSLGVTSEQVATLLQRVRDIRGKSASEFLPEEIESLSLLYRIVQGTNSLSDPSKEAAMSALQKLVVQHPHFASTRFGGSLEGAFNHPPRFQDSESAMRLAKQVMNGHEDAKKTSTALETVIRMREGFAKMKLGAQGLEFVEAVRDYLEISLGHPITEMDAIAHAYNVSKFIGEDTSRFSTIVMHLGVSVGELELEMTRASERGAFREAILKMKSLRGEAK